MPLSPFTSAIAARSRSTRIFGRGFAPPAWKRRMYCGRRKMPCPSEPCRSASSMSAEMVVASSAGTPTRWRAFSVNVLKASARSRSIA